MSKLLWNISKLRNWDKNPRAIKSNKFQELKERIKKYGQFKPIITTLDGEVIGGNMRLRAMKDLGIQEIWVSVVEPKTEAEKIEIALADNEEMGYYQEDQLAELISSYKDEIKLDSFSIHLGDGVNLEDLLNKYQPEEVIEDDAPEVEEEAISELGAIYQLGRHRLMCGDSTKIEDVEKLMNGQKADMVFTDPPYGVGYEGGHNKKKRSGIDNDKLQGTDLTQLFHDSIANAVVMSKDHSAFYIWYASGKSVETFASFVGLGLELRAVIQWYKVHSGLGAFMSQYIPNCEPCMYAFKSGCSPQWFGASDEKTVWELKREGKSEFHPTQKPIELCSRAIKNSSKSEDIILDLFGGSGSTLIACEQLNRTCYMMELDPRYVDVIRKRYAKFIGKENEWQEVTPRIN